MRGFEPGACVDLLSSPTFLGAKGCPRPAECYRFRWCAATPSPWPRGPSRASAIAGGSLCSGGGVFGGGARVFSMAMHRDQDWMWSIPW